MFLKGEIGATWLRGYFTTRLSGYVTRRLRSYVATSIKERVKFFCSVLVSAQGGGRNRGCKSPFSLLSQPISPSSLLFEAIFFLLPKRLPHFFSLLHTFSPYFSLLPTFFGPFFPPPYSVAPPSSRIILSAHG